MKFSSSILLASMGFLGLARANFDLYIEIQTEPISGTVTRFWKIFEAEPDCAGVSDSLGYFDEDDASGGRAVRCEGDGCDPSGDVNTITELEMNFGTEGGPVWHWTIYKDRNFDMIGLDGNTYGNCILFPGDDYQCSGVPIQNGVRKFRCLTQYTVGDIEP